MAAAAPARLMVAGSAGDLSVAAWTNPDARYVALLSHGYAEHIGRYEHVAQRLLADGAVVYGPDHAGHGESGGERALIEKGENLTADLHLVAGLAREQHPGLPVTLIGHSMGGLIAVRYVQRRGGEGLAALVLSGPAIGASPGFEMLLQLEPLPDVPIDVAVLSRDPAVGVAYTADPLVYSGPFKRATLESLLGAIAEVAAGPRLELPTLWLHGEEDQLIPIEPVRDTIGRIRGERLEEKSYPGARHEIFNELNQDEVLDDVVEFIGRHV